ncbi:MAG: response regulator [Hydrotalea flava]|jgi:DNA-binding NarL/FixJ family response regulator|nr:MULTISPECIES: response regulator transcription factor [Hydrotalea]NIM34776.1 response regulator [Hydrotalea flava]NIM37612.1 response regulator [Hydrotalea flava]NIN02772.1 response regulator [Hydrotalea flava]NIN14457.1 response regulator [Hydrotalea flava]NIO93538.1 response regulator [Hydrotalea flava]
MSSALNLVLVDAKPAYLLKLQHMVNTIPYLNILFTANHGVDCLQKLQQVKTEPDVIITDLLMPEMDGMGLAAILHYARPALPIIVLSDLLSEFEIAELMDIGVKGFLSKKKLSHAVLEQAIDAVSYRKDFIDTTAFDIAQVHKAVDHFNKLPYEKNITQQLTNKELLYLQLLVTMENEEEIATCMHISVKTVQYYANNLRKKTDTSSKSALVLLAIKNRWVKIYKGYVSSHH